MCNVLGFFLVIFPGCFQNFLFIFGFSSALVTYCCVANYFKTYQLKQYTLTISQFLWVRNPEFGHNFLSLSHISVFSGLTVRNLHIVHSCDCCQHSVPYGLLARWLGFSWTIVQRLPSVLCHMVLSIQHLTTWQLVSWKQARGRERESERQRQRDTQRECYQEL